MRTKTIVALAVMAALGAAGCGGSIDVGSDQCIVLANGGNKLCGSDAAAWCRSTDAIRQGSTDPSLQSAQATCDSIEAQYGGSTGSTGNSGNS